jgi:hypothetical protein
MYPDAGADIRRTFCHAVDKTEDAGTVLEPHDEFEVLVARVGKGQCRRKGMKNGRRLAVAAFPLESDSLLRMLKPVLTASVV